MATSFVLGILGGLAKKLLKDRAVKIGKAVYERTFKPIIGKLRDRALELTRRLLRNPDDVDLEVEEDIQTLERAEAKLPVESLEPSREPTSVVAEEAQGTGRQSGRVKESYAMKRTQLRDKALDLTRRLLMNPDDVDLERNLAEVEEDIKTLERTEAKLSAESLEQSRARSRVEDAELEQRYKIKPGDGYDAEKAFMDAEVRAKGRVVGGQPSTIDFGSGYTQSYAMKRVPPPKIGDALQAIGGITEESVFGVELAPIKEKLKPTFEPDVPEFQQIRDALGGTAVQLWQEAARGRRRHPGGDAVYSAGREALAGRPDGAGNVPGGEKRGGGRWWRVALRNAIGEVGANDEGDGARYRIHG